MGDDILSFEDHRRHRDDDDLVRCARCGKKILATVLRCPECGVHFQGEAQDFSHPSEGGKTDRPLWIIIVALVLLFILVTSSLGIL